MEDQPRARESAAHRPLRTAGGATLLGLPLLVFALLWFSMASRSAFWTDEIFSFFMCGRPEVGVGGVWSAVRDGRDGMLPVFYLTHWLWGATFEPWVAGMAAGMARCPHELAWRAPSLLALLGGTLALGLALARRTGWARASAALTLALLGATPLLAHGGGFRAYGMLFGLFALLCAILLAYADRPGPIRWVSAATVAALLSFTHLLGLVFAGAACLGLAASARPPSVRAMAARLGLLAPSALLIVAHLPALNRTAELITPWGWIPRPALDALPEGFLVGGLNPWVPPALMACAAIALLRGPGQSPRTDTESARPPALPLWLALAILAVPPALWLLSQYSHPVFLDRYFLPVSIAGGLAGSLALGRLGGAPACAALTLTVCALTVASPPRLPLASPPPGASPGAPPYPLARMDWNPPHTFHVTDSIHEFTRNLIYESDPGVRHFHIQDAERARTPGSGAPRRLAHDINLTQAHARTWTETGGLNGIPPDLLLPVADAEAFVEFLPTRMRVILTDTTDIQAGGEFARLLTAAGWRAASRRILPPPPGSPGPSMVRTEWSRPARPPETRSP